MIFLPLALALSATTPITLDVDATEVSRRLLHTKIVIPVKAGPLTLHYPKWIPGEHGPTGPIDGMINLKISGAGKAIAWRRDPTDMYAFRVTVPAAVTSLDVAFDFVTPTEGGSFSGGPNASEHRAALSFNHVLLVPDGRSDDVNVRTRVTIPAGWDGGTALSLEKRTGQTFDFTEQSLTTVVDSPMIIGRFFRRFPIDATHGVSVVADSAAALEVPTDVVTQWTQLVGEAGAMFGSRHYRRYEFLITLSNHGGGFALEHHESSDNRLPERYYIDEDVGVYVTYLLPHEYAHSWNGKFRRPTGLATGDYNAPYDDEMLWVYEGLTDYLGMVLSSRSGLSSTDEWAGDWGLWFAQIDQPAGRSWRPLQDTADFAQHLYITSHQWTDARRSVDFYPEGALLWLDVDMRIRTMSGGKKSLDDFVRGFHGGPGGKPDLKPFSFDDVVTALNAVQPYDWKGFWRKSLDETSARAPMAALNAAGWKIAWSDEPTPSFKANNALAEIINEQFSLGLQVQSEDNVIVDVMGGSPAWKAGVSPGMKLIGVNGRKLSPETLTDVIRASKTSKDPIELLVENAEFFRVLKVDYHDGLRYPKLVRDTTKPDTMSAIFKPKTPHKARTPKKK